LSTIGHECPSVVSFAWSSVEAEIIGFVACEKVPGHRTVIHLERSHLNSPLQVASVGFGPYLATHRLPREVLDVPPPWACVIVSRTIGVEALRGFWTTIHIGRFATSQGWIRRSHRRHGRWLICGGFRRCICGLTGGRETGRGRNGCDRSNFHRR
jgi:hypothetical protein